MRFSDADQALNEVLTDGSWLTGLDINLSARRASVLVMPFIEPGDGTCRSLMDVLLEFKDVSRVQLWTTSKALLAQLGTNRAPAPELIRLIARTFLGPVHAEWTPFGLKLGPTYPGSQLLWDLELAPAADAPRVFAGECFLDQDNALVLFVEFGTLEIASDRRLNEAELLGQVREARAEALLEAQALHRDLHPDEELDSQPESFPGGSG